MNDWQPQNRHGNIASWLAPALVFVAAIALYVSYVASVAR